MHGIKDFSGQKSGNAAPMARSSRRTVVTSKLKAKASPSKVDLVDKRPSIFPFLRSKPTVEKASSNAEKKMPMKGSTALGSFISALDFSEVRSKSDAALLYDAKYGKLENGKMSREQYQALRRKVRLDLTLLYHCIIILQCDGNQTDFLVSFAARRLEALHGIFGRPR